MDRRSIVVAGLRFGLLSGLFELAVQLISFAVVTDNNLVTITAGLALQALIIGEAGRLMARATGRLRAAAFTGAVAGGLSELISHSVARAVFPLTPAGVAASHALTPSQWAQVNDPAYIALNLFVSVVSLIVLGAVYGLLGAWSEVRWRE